MTPEATQETTETRVDPELIQSISSKIINPDKLPRRWGARLRNWRTALHRGRARGATIIESKDKGEYLAIDQSAGRLIGAFTVERLHHRPSRSKYTPHRGEKQLRKSWKEVAA